MRLGRPKAPPAPQLARRARIVLGCAEGHANAAVAKRVRIRLPTDW
jgi:hypothetical protein